MQTQFGGKITFVLSNCLMNRWGILGGSRAAEKLKWYGLD